MEMLQGKLRDPIKTVVVDMIVAVHRHFISVAVTRLKHRFRKAKIRVHPSGDDTSCIVGQFLVKL